MIQFSRKVVALAIALLIVQSVFGQQLWGLTSRGGQFDRGTIFHTDINGTNLVTEHEFYALNDGKSPSDARLCEAPNGKLYGTTPVCTTFPGGVLYEFDPLTNAYTVKHYFSTPALGNAPEAGLVIAGNGKMYGTTSTGGIYDGGTIYEYDPVTEIVTKKIDFDGPILGSGVYSELTLASNGLLYGVANSGGANFYGVLFEYDPVANTCTKKIDFDLNALGAFPKADIVEAGNGKLYSITHSGGAYNDGTIVEYDPIAQTAVNVFDFDFLVTGGNSVCPMMLASNGKLYGFTTDGGVYDKGTLFEFDVSTNTFVKKADLDGSLLGDKPFGGLLEVSNGVLYGMTYTGGLAVRGAILEYQIAADTLIKKYDFYSNNGIFPKGTFIKASNGKLYATTFSGQVSGSGVLFEYDYITDSYLEKLKFEDESNGARPSSGLVQADNGKLYGLTEKGGAYGKGVLYELDPATGVYTVKHSFDQSSGYDSFGVLFLAQNGKLYGGAKEGGGPSKGTIYEYDPNTEIFVVKYNFNYNGNEGVSNFKEVSPGVLMGITLDGGFQGDGVVYLFNYYTNTYAYKASFHGILDGRYPACIMAEASNGNFYGVAGGGGPGVQKGTVYEYDPVATDIDLKVNFEGLTNGGSPLGYPILGDNGKVYGANSIGAAYNKGCLFEYDALLDIYSVKYDFQHDSLGYDIYSLMNASTGKLYALGRGGDLGFGVIIEYDVLNNTYTKTHDFDSINGDDPLGYPLLEIGSCYITSSSLTVAECNTYTVPSGNQTFSAAGNYSINDVIPNSCGGDSLIAINLTISNDAATDLHIECDSLVWIDGNTYTSSNSSATHTIPNGGMNGCDSLIFLDLTIVNPAIGADIRTECTSYTWVDGNTYTSDNNTASYTMLNGSANGCDSTIVLDLTIVNPQYGTDVITECYSLTWIDGNTYTSNNNTAVYTLSNGASNGCDSIITLDLTLNGGPAGIDTQVSCGPFTWINFIIYSSSTTIPSTVLPGAAANGCDSTVVLNLTVLNSTTGIDTQVACEPFTWIDGNTYSAFNNTATYTLSGAASNGCDSIVTLNLTMSTIDATASQLDQITLEANSVNATYQWLDCLNGYAVLNGETNQTFTATSNGEYAVEVTENGCADTSSCFVIAHVGLPTIETFESIRVYPNPTQNVMTIESDVEMEQIRVFDPQGRIVLEAAVVSKKYLIDMTDLESGVYFLEVESAGGVQGLRISCVR